jgi:hypothetical protein
MQSRLKKAKAIGGVPAARVQISLSATVHTKAVNSAPKNSRLLQAAQFIFAGAKYKLIMDAGHLGYRHLWFLFEHHH